jgi:hypothetical protein
MNGDLLCRDCGQHHETGGEALACDERQQLRPTFPWIWWWRCRLPERKGEPCRITAGGSLNSVRVEFPDGFTVITSRWAGMGRR